MVSQLQQIRKYARTSDLVFWSDPDPYFKLKSELHSRIELSFQDLLPDDIITVSQILIRINSTQIRNPVSLFTCDIEGCHETDEYWDGVGWQLRLHSLEESVQVKLCYVLHIKFSS